jgi:hypothetical protein
MARRSSDILTGHIHRVYEGPSAGPGVARDTDPPTEDPWRRPQAQGTPNPPEPEVIDVAPVVTIRSGPTQATFETEEGMVVQAIEELPLDETKPMRLPVEHGYEGLAAILDEALAQAQSGKGKDRHARDGQRFEDQPIFAINQLLGSLDGNAYQIIKKVSEAVGQIRKGNAAGGRRDLLGAIVYAAATIALADQGLGKG